MTVLEYMRSRGIKVSGKMFPCPSPGHDDRHASASAKGEVWYCHGCGAKGNLVSLIALVEGCSIKEALERAGKPRMFNLRIPPPAKPIYPSEYDRKMIHSAAVRVDWDRTGEVDMALAFELARGSELPEWAKTWRGRVIFPLRDCFGAERSFVARAKGKSAAKTLTPKGYSTKGLGFFTGIGYSSTVIIAEGEMDYLAGLVFSDTVIGLRNGTWNTGWRKLLDRWPHIERVEVCTDNDKAGHRYAREVLGVEPSPWLRRKGSSKIEFVRRTFGECDLEEYTMGMR